MPAVLRLTPQGHLILDDDPDAPAIAEETAARLREAFARGSEHGLLQLGAAEVTTHLLPAFAYWRDFAGRVRHRRMRHSGGRRCPARSNRASDRIGARCARRRGAADDGPRISGSGRILATLWRQLDAAFRAELSRSRLSLEAFLHRRHAAWSVVGRVHFNLAEYKLDPETPFAFLATYTTSLSARGKAQHAPLGRALEEFAGAKNKPRLLSLLLPVQRASASIAWLKEMVDAGDVFHPLRWTADEAYRLLQEVDKLEAAGVIVRLPAHWKSGRPARAQARAVVGTKPPAGIGTEALLDFRMAVTLDGDVVDRRRDRVAPRRHRRPSLAPRPVGRGPARHAAEDDRRVRTHRANRRRTWRDVRRGDAPRRRARRSIATRPKPPTTANGRTSSPDRGCANSLLACVGPKGWRHVESDSRVNATLRPYQNAGVKWLHLLSSLGLGACLADDMGLGKTLQVLALIASRGARRPGDPPVLVVAPASLLANWAAEIARFTPSLTVLVAHTSSIPRAELLAIDPARVDAADIVITSYGSLLRLPWMAERRWRLVVVDEAQAIKNPSARQTRAVKALDAPARIALTGTPVENRLTDLWSIFDVVNPGLLGSHKQFATWTKRLSAGPQGSFAPLRELVRPYILRRMKTDPSVIADLPAKTEVAAYCTLTPRQAALYQQSVDELKRRIGGTEGIERRGLVLSFLLRFKQITNHPSHWLGDDKWLERGQRQIPAPARDCGDHRVASGEGAGLHAVPRNDRTAVVVPDVGVQPPRARAARRHAGRPAPEDRRAVSAGRAHALFRPVAQGRRHRAQSHGRVSCRFTSIDGGIRRSKTRRPIARSASARRSRCSSTSSSAAERWKRRSRSCWPPRPVFPATCSKAAARFR